jgi:hypothetical protein
MSLIACTLTYLEPLLVNRNPVEFEQEVSKHHFTATDETDAKQKAELFLEQHVVSCNHVEKGRVGKTLKQTKPIQKMIKCHFRQEQLSLTGS